MKRIFTLALALVMVLSIVALAGCGSTGSSTDTPKASEKVIGLSFPAADHGWVAAVLYNAENQAKELGVKYILTTGANANEQSGKVDELIAQKVDAIVILPCDTDPMTPAAQRILDAGIPLIVFDRKVNVEPTFYLAGDNAGIGVNAAKFIGEKLGGKGTVVSVGVPGYGSVSTERLKGFSDTLAKEFPNIKIAKEVGAENSSKEGGLKVMSNLLSAEKQIDAVFSIDDEMSIGILQAIKENKRTDIKVLTGGGGAKEFFQIIKSEKTMDLVSFLYSPTMVKEAVKIGVDIMNGKKPADKTKIIPANGITRDNVDSIYDENSPY